MIETVCFPPASLLLAPKARRRRIRPARKRTKPTKAKRISAIPLSLMALDAEALKSYPLTSFAIPTTYINLPSKGRRGCYTSPKTRLVYPTVLYNQSNKDQQNPAAAMTTTPITTPTSPSFRWRAIVNRDANVNDFVYGVRTTKIYCRPRCPARLARRANVEFYDTPKQAEKAGYRPCKRCKPEDLKAPPDPHIKLAQRACETMMLAAMANRKAQALGPSGGPNGIPSGPTGWGGAGQRSRPTLQDLANEAGLTPSHFHRVFKKVVGLTPGKFAREVMEGKKMGAIMKRLAEADSADGTGAGLPKDDEVDFDFSSPVSVTTSSLGGSPVIDDVRSSPLTDADSYVLPDPAEIRIDWNEFDRMLGASSSGVGMDVGQNSSSNHNHSHNSFRIANPTVNELPHQQHLHHHQQQQPLPTTTTTSPTAAAVSGASHILDPSCSSSPANILLDYQLPWDSPPNPTTTTLNFPTITTTACCGKPTSTGITITSGNGNGNGSPTNTLLSPYDSFLPLDMDMSMGPDFCYTFGTTNHTTNHTNNHSNNHSHHNAAFLDKLPHLDLISAPSSENSSTPGAIDTPPFLDGLASLSASASASPLLFDEVDWYGSPSVFQSYV
ncbi:hypothetical protein FQN52_004579 [Onygenales sp. PD_12]|nr:hypothetical protein FQN52_004579 [Onygenales sp. PD_12]